jgi:hypothetical protein
MKNTNRVVSVFFGSEDMNQVLLRLAAAGWVTGTGGDNPETPRVNYSQDGVVRMCELSLLLMAYYPRIFGISPTTPKPEAANCFDAIFSSPSIALELISPPLTEREQWAFIELLSLLAMRNLKGGKDEPETTG